MDKKASVSQVRRRVPSPVPPFEVGSMGFPPVHRCCSLALLALSLLCEDAFAGPQPNAAWMRGARKRLAEHANLNPDKRQASYASSCAVTTPPDFAAPKQNVWSGLTDWEAASVTKWLFGQSDLNLTVSEDAGEWDNKILLVELMLPNKTDVLPYIDGGAAAPARYAHVVLDLRATFDPVYQDILVGPLPVVNGSTTWQPLEYPLTRKTDGKVRNLDANDESYEPWLLEVGATVADITFDLWGATAAGYSNDTLNIWGIDPVWYKQPLECSLRD